ncbi:MAG: hypothetical protein KC422_17960 [Trueperaceae bacterium]|nr:hypothetical protein [Trueperaceae bacterium]
MIRVRFADEQEAYLEAGHWTCDDARLERLLNAMSCPWEMAEPKDRSQAEIASKVLGLEIVETN